MNIFANLISLNKSHSETKQSSRTSLWSGSTLRTIRSEYFGRAFVHNANTLETGKGVTAQVALLSHQQPIKEYFASSFGSDGQFLITSAELVDDFQGVEVVVNAGGQSVTLTTNDNSKQFQGSKSGARIVGSAY